MTLPGQAGQEFTVRKYKEDIGKPYYRITFYLCPEESDLDRLESSENNGSGDDRSDQFDQNVR